MHGIFGKSFTRLYSETKLIDLEGLKTIYQRQKKALTAELAFKSFEEIPSVPLSVLQAMERCFGVHTPTPLQGTFLAHYFSQPRSDLLLKAQPGCGKTFAYTLLLAVLDTLNQKKTCLVRKDGPQHLVLVPTNILAHQVARWYHALSGLSCSLVTGEEKALLRDCRLVVGTPESTRVAFADGSMSTKDIETIILDETDAMIKALSRNAPASKLQQRQRHPVPAVTLLEEIITALKANPLNSRPKVICASATLNRATRDLLCRKKLLQSPILIEDARADPKVEVGNSSAKVLHFHRLLKDHENVDEFTSVLQSILRRHDNRRGRGLVIIPADQSKIGLMQLIRERGVAQHVALLNDANIMTSEASLLIGSDTDCRGLHLPKLDFVIILDLPKSAERYIHMAGRVGRLESDQSRAPGAVYTILGDATDLARFTQLLHILNITSVPL